MSNPEEAKHMLTMSKEVLEYSKGELNLEIQTVNAEEYFSGIFDNLSALYNRGAYYRGEERYREALHDINKYVALHPVDPHALVERSILYAKVHMYENALLDLKNAEKIDPTHSEIYKNRSVIYARIGNYDQSHWELKKYLSFEPDDSEMWSILATLKRLKINNPE